eukprot:Awhi_evm1s13548
MDIRQTCELVSTGVNSCRELRIIELPSHICPATYKSLESPIIRSISPSSHGVELPQEQSVSQTKLGSSCNNSSIVLPSSFC